MCGCVCVCGCGWGVCGCVGDVWGVGWSKHMHCAQCYILIIQVHAVHSCVGCVPSKSSKYDSKLYLSIFLSEVPESGVMVKPAI